MVNPALLWITSCLLALFVKVISKHFKFICFCLALAAESELKKYGQFVEDYTERLKQGLKHNKVLKTDAQILPNVKKDNPLRMVSSPYEGISLPDLVLGCTDNTMLGKVILALSAICSEMEFLVSDEELKIKFLDPLLLYGTEIAGTVKLGHNDHGYNEFTAITNKICTISWSQMVRLLHESSWL